MNKDQLMNKLYMLDFMAVDLHLYLNTHPHDKDALAEYNKVVELASQVREDYEKMYGPLCSYRSLSRSDEWNWLSEHSPWEACYNVNICQGGTR